MNEELSYRLQRFALEIRIGILEQLKFRRFGHSGGSLSAADLLAVLYGAELRHDPAHPHWDGRDKLVCSKGHAGPAVYAALAIRGFFPYETLQTLNRPGTILPSHCDRLRTPGIDMTTGSLGQGASAAVGIAFAKKQKGALENVFLLVGDGESNEGQVWEAAMFAAAHHLDRLFWFIDENKKQLDGYTSEILKMGNLQNLMEAFGFDARRIDGHDVGCIYDAIEQAKLVTGKPHAIILETVKGRGVNALEKTYMNHAAKASWEEWELWQNALKAELADLDREWEARL